MRIHAIVYLRSTLAAIVCALLWSASAVAQPCTYTPSGGSPQNVSQAAQKLASAVTGLRSAFSRLKPSNTANTAQPCPATASAEPVSTTSAAASPGSLQVGQAPATSSNAPIGPNEPYGSSLIPPAPPGGLDPSKLPDVLGIHIGEPTDQVIAQVLKIYPKTAVFTSILGTQRYAYSSDPQYTASIGQGKKNVEGCAGGDCLGQDTINVLFSGPPDQRAVELVRGLTWGSGNEPTAATLRAAVIQKYGQTFSENAAAGEIFWLFDEEGNPLPPQSKLAAMNCGGLLAFGGGSGSALPDYLYRSPPPQVVTQQDLDRFAKISCGRKVFVQAQIGVQSAGTASTLTVTIREYAADLRDAFAAENLMRQNKLAQGNQQLKNAQQQATPSF